MSKNVGKTLFLATKHWQHIDFKNDWEMRKNIKQTLVIGVSSLIGFTTNIADHHPEVDAHKTEVELQSTDIQKFFRTFLWQFLGHVCVS